MAHDLSLAQSHAFHLCNDLMVPITLFKSGSEFGVLPSDELDDEDDLLPAAEVGGALLAVVRFLDEVELHGTQCVPNDTPRRVREGERSPVSKNIALQRPLEEFQR